MCNCEHKSHFDGSDHEYMKAQAGDKTAQFVGPVCNHCAETHMSSYPVAK